MHPRPPPKAIRVIRFLCFECIEPFYMHLFVVYPNIMLILKTRDVTGCQIGLDVQAFVRIITEHCCKHEPTVTIIVGYTYTISL